MPKYLNILVAVNYKDFEEHVGVFIDNGKVDLIGEAILKHKNGKIFADIKTNQDLSDYYPTTKNLDGIIDVLVFTPKQHNKKIEKIKEQIRHRKMP